MLSHPMTLWTAPAARSEVSQANSQGQTPLAVATMNKQEESIKILQERLQRGRRGRLCAVSIIPSSSPYETRSDGSVKQWKSSGKHLDILPFFGSSSDPCVFPYATHMIKKPEQNVGVSLVRSVVLPSIPDGVCQSLGPTMALPEDGVLPNFMVHHHVPQ